MATIVTRAGKGSPLTNAEMDANLTNLNAEFPTKQPLDATLTALAGLDTVSGLVEQTGTDAFAKRAISADIKAFLDAADKAAARTALSVPTLLDAWPVGAVYTSVVSTSPATLFGGTWVAFGAGRVLVGIDSTQTEFDVVEEVGGAKTHTLTTAEMPAHTHGISDAEISGAGGTGTWRAAAGALQNSSSTGGGGAHNNLQPYIVVYFWKRTV